MCAGGWNPEYWEHFCFVLVSYHRVTKVNLKMHQEFTSKVDLDTQAKLLSINVLLTQTETTKVWWGRTTMSRHHTHSTSPNLLRRPRRRNLAKTSGAGHAFIKYHEHAYTWAASQPQPAGALTTPQLRPPGTRLDNTFLSLTGYFFQLRRPLSNAPFQFQVKESHRCGLLERCHLSLGRIPLAR